MSALCFRLLSPWVSEAHNEDVLWVPESLELRQLCLGTQTPMLSGLRASELVGGRSVPLSLATLQGLSASGSAALAPCHRVSLRGCVELHPCDDFRCVLRTRLFGKGCVAVATA